MEYVYYHLKTNSISEKWNTGEIEAYLSQCDLFPSEHKHNSFTSENPFLSISLMNVCDYNSWSWNDYDSKNTNYISIVTSDDCYWGINKNDLIQAVLDGLEELLNTKIQEEW